MAAGGDAGVDFGGGEVGGVWRGGGGVGETHFAGLCEVIGWVAGCFMFVRIVWCREGEEGE